MTPAELTKAQDLLRRRADITRYVNDREDQFADASVSLYRRRSGPGNDRDYLSVNIPIADAKAYLSVRLREIEDELKAMGVEL